jgi:hypothetical protein
MEPARTYKLLHGDLLFAALYKGTSVFFMPSDTEK